MPRCKPRGLYLSDYNAAKYVLCLIYSYQFLNHTSVTFYGCKYILGMGRFLRKISFFWRYKLFWSFWNLRAHSYDHFFCSLQLRSTFQTVLDARVSITRWSSDGINCLSLPSLKSIFSKFNHIFLSYEGECNSIFFLVTYKCNL